MAQGNTTQEIRINFDTSELEARLSKAAVVLSTLMSRLESLEERMEKINQNMAKAETTRVPSPRKHRG